MRVERSWRSKWMEPIPLSSTVCNIRTVQCLAVRSRKEHSAERGSITCVRATLFATQQATQPAGTGQHTLWWIEVSSM